MNHPQFRSRSRSPLLALGLFALGIIVSLPDISTAQDSTSQDSTSDVRRIDPEAREVRGTAERILQDPEFRHFTRIGEDATLDESEEWQWPFDDDAQQKDDPRKERKEAKDETDRSRVGDLAMDLGGAFGELVRFAVWAVLIGVVVWMLYLAWRAFGDAERSLGAPQSLDDRLEGEEPLIQAPGDVPEDEYLAQARALAGEGRYADAISQLLLGGMSHLERTGVIRYRRGITYRDYLRAAKGRTTQYQGFRLLVRIYEPIGFGRRPATREQFEDGLASYESGFLGAS